MNRIIFSLFFCVSSTISLGMNDDTKQSTRRFSIGDYSEYLLNCLAAEDWWRNNPYKKYRKSDFHQYDERLRRLSDSFPCDLKNEEKAILRCLRNASDQSDKKKFHHKTIFVHTTTFQD